MPHYDSPDLRPLSVLLSDLGKQIEAYRISRNLKQAELAEMAGISRSTLARLEAGNGGTIDSLARIMRALEIEDRLLDVLPDAKSEESRVGKECVSTCSSRREPYIKKKNIYNKKNK